MKKIYIPFFIYERQPNQVQPQIFVDSNLFHHYLIYSPVPRRSEGCNVLVATPVRLLDFAERCYITVAVLDEADRMPDVGFMSNIGCCVSNPKMPQGGQLDVHIRRNQPVCRGVPTQLSLPSALFSALCSPLSAHCSLLTAHCCWTKSCRDLAPATMIAET